MKNNKIKEKRKSVIKEKYGVDNISKLQSVKDKRKNTNLTKFGTEHFVNSKAFKDTMILNYGVDNPMKNTEIKHKATLTLINNNNVKVSKQEIALCKELYNIYGKENCVPSFYFKNFIFDCLLKIDDFLIDVEYDGSYWHKSRKNYDRRRDEIIKKYGFKVLRIESEKDRIPTELQIKECIEYLISSDNHKYSHIIV